MVSDIWRIVLQEPLVISNKGRVIWNPQSKSVEFFSVINEADATKSTKEKAAAGKVPGILANFKTVPNE